MAERLPYYEQKYSKLRDVTLCYLVSGDGKKVLIAMKKRGFGKGKLNGIGGKVESGESITDALIRETSEEIGARLLEFEKVGRINFYFENSPPDKDFNQCVHVFLGRKWEGEPSESEEMAPVWTDVSSLPLEKMWADDEYWLPLVLSGKKILASFLFENEEKISEMNIEEVNEVE
jgi:8-oxo-dGTP pyrophosphatase MutT (NUDIX family)